jgi:hypothetical protein
VFGETRWTRRYSRYSSAGPTGTWSRPSTVHVRSPLGSTSRCDRHPQPTVAFVTDGSVETGDNSYARDTPEPEQASHAASKTDSGNPG